MPILAALGSPSKTELTDQAMAKMSKNVPIINVDQDFQSIRYDLLRMTIPKTESVQMTPNKKNKNSIPVNIVSNMIFLF